MRKISFALLTPLMSALLAPPVFSTEDPKGFIRGDANADGLRNIADVSTINSYLQGQNNITCLNSADLNNSTSINSSDTTFLINYLFAGGPAPDLPGPPPFPGCGQDSGGSLGCNSHKKCDDGGGDLIKTHKGRLTFEDFDIPPGGRGTARVLLSNPGSTQTIDLQGFYLAVDSPPELELVEINIDGTLPQAIGADLIIPTIASPRSGRLVVFMDLNDQPHAFKTLPLTADAIPIANFIYTCKEQPIPPAPDVAHTISFGVELSGAEKEGLFPVLLPLVDLVNAIGQHEVYIPNRETGTATCQGKPGHEFLRGDANGDGRVNIADPVTIMMYFVGDGGLACLDTADANNSSSINFSDPVYLLNYIFFAGPAPDGPFPGCGTDTNTSLGCTAHRFCEP